MPFSFFRKQVRHSLENKNKKSENFGLAPADKRGEMKHLFISSLLLAVFILTSCGPHNYSRDNAYSLPGGSSSGGGGGGDPVAGCGGMNATACETFHLINNERINQGLKPLEICETCVKAAQEQSEDMKSCGYFAHDRPQCPTHAPETFQQRMGRWGLWGGENIAGGYMSPAAAVDGWMHSPPHRANILNTSYGSTGVGFVENEYTQVFSQ